MSTTKRLRSNLRGSKKGRFSSNKNNLRKKVLEKSAKKKNKNLFRIKYTTNNLPYYPKLQQIYSSHHTNLENFKRSETQRKKNDRSIS